MLKAADALAEAGYEVRMVSARYMDWAWQADQDVRRTRSWKWTVVNYDRWQGTTQYFRSGARFRSAKFLAKFAGPSRCPLGLAANAYSRAHEELLKAILNEPADLVYGGTAGALAAVALAAAREGVPYALDLEDFHSAEHRDDAEGHLFGRLAERIERRILPGAAMLTTAGSAMGAAYEQEYGVHAVTVNNTHPLPSVPPDLSPSSTPGLRLYWFGQTVGPDKGLDTLIRAVGLARITVQLHIRGRAEPRALEGLRRMAGNCAPSLDIIHHEPVPPDSLVESCKGYDVGLASFDPSSSYNCQIAAPNKPCTYILGGLAVAISDTPGQRPLGLDLGEGAIFHRLGDADALAAGLKRWADDKSLLARAKAAAWDAAKRRWHWEHPLERGALLRAVAAVFQQ
jgi:glycosyltransferase involved in cell wall biosynthesis